MYGTLFFHNTALCFLGRFDMFLYHVDLLNDQPVFLCDILKTLPVLPLSLPVVTITRSFFFT